MSNDNDRVSGNAQVFWNAQVSGNAYTPTIAALEALAAGVTPDSFDMERLAKDALVLLRQQATIIYGVKAWGRLLADVGRDDHV